MGLLHLEPEEPTTSISWIWVSPVQVRSPTRYKAFPDNELGKAFLLDFCNPSHCNPFCNPTGNREFAQRRRNGDPPTAGEHGVGEGSYLLCRSCRQGAAGGRLSRDSGGLRH